MGADDVVLVVTAAAGIGNVNTMRAALESTHKGV
jgi:hypothetical protein